LEYSRTVSYAEKYYQEFKESAVHIRDSLPLIFRLYMGIVETLVYIQLCRIFQTLELEYKFED